jgi:hypothetical protein
LAELGQAFDERVDRAVGLQAVSPPERGQDALAGLPLLAEGLGDLEILIEDPVLDATLEPEEHTIIITIIWLSSRGRRN